MKRFIISIVVCLSAIFLFSMWYCISSEGYETNIVNEPAKPIKINDSDNDNAKTIDVVCGREIDKGTASYECEYEGKTYYFCSQWCKTQFGMDPTSFVESEDEGKDKEDSSGNPGE